MSSQDIKDAALHLFAENGYDGTSLSNIAEKVGLKKQSIYSHFKSKDDLFLQILKDTFIIELQREKDYLADHFEDQLHDCLFNSLRTYIERFHTDSRLKFLLRVSFFPPAHLYGEIISSLYSHIDQVDALYLERFQRAIEQKEMKQADAEIANMAFASLIDAICVELVYGGTLRTERKLKASWTIFWNGITHHE